MTNHMMAGLGVFCLMSSTACAQDNDSAYVTVFESCTQHEAKNEPVWYSDCAGYDDWTVHIIAGEHGSAVAYSDRGQDIQWRENPPRIGPFQDLGNVMEWRLNEEGDAFATIHRTIYSGYDSDQNVDPHEGQYLTVTALRREGPVGGCHVAYVEAAQQAGANQIARDAADMLAPDWQCGVEEPYVFDLDSEMGVATLAAQRMPGH